MVLDRLYVSYTGGWSRLIIRVASLLRRRDRCIWLPCRRRGELSRCESCRRALVCADGGRRYLTGAARRGRHNSENVGTVRLRVGRRSDGAEQSDLCIPKCIRVTAEPGSRLWLRMYTKRAGRLVNGSGPQTCDIRGSAAMGYRRAGPLAPGGFVCHRRPSHSKTGCRAANEQNLEDHVGDFVILRADGLFAYQLAVVVDDHDRALRASFAGQISLTPPHVRFIYSVCSARLRRDTFIHQSP